MLKGTGTNYTPSGKPALIFMQMNTKENSITMLCESCFNGFSWA
jgi:hypothetical protein